MRIWAGVAVLGAAVAAAAWVPGGRAHAEPHELRIEWVGWIDTAGALPSDSWLGSFALANDTPYTWTYPVRHDEPAFDRWVRALGGWEAFPEGGYHGSSFERPAGDAVERGRIRPGEKVPFLVFGNQRRGVQRLQIELTHRSARKPVIAVSPPIEESLFEEQLLPQQLHGFEHARPR